jgi:hypothetical protein
MITAISLAKLKQTTELIPHAVLKIPIWYIAKLMEVELERGHDDLDYYEGIGAIYKSGFPFAVMHYRGYPENTSAIYLPRDFSDDVARITKAVHDIASEFKLPDKAFLWERNKGETL